MSSMTVRTRPSHCSVTVSSTITVESSAAAADGGAGGGDGGTIATLPAALPLLGVVCAAAVMAFLCAREVGGGDPRGATEVEVREAR